MIGLLHVGWNQALVELAHSSLNNLLEGFVLLAADLAK